MKRFFGSLDRFNCLLQFIHCNGPGEQIDGVSGGPEDGAVQSLEDSGGLLRPRVKNCFTCPPQNMSSFIADAEPEKPNKNAPSRALPNERARGVLINLGEQCVWYQSRVVH